MLLDRGGRMNIAVFLKILHVFLAFWFVSGLIGRWIALHEASCSREIHTTFALLQIASIFERLMVIPGSMAVVIFGLLTAVAQGWPVLGFLQGRQPQWLLISLLLFLSLFPVIRWIFLPRGKVFEQALQDALSQGMVTSRLTAAFHDRVVYAAHVYELASVALIIFLMIAKPF
jgi:Predicted integral membrane protein (DUF2269)